MLTRFHVAGAAVVAAVAIVIVATGDIAAQGRSVRLTPGERTIISLRENPTTGYVWHFDQLGSTNAVIVNVHDLGFSRLEATGPMVGTPGMHRWSIEGVRSGRARLLFVNSRPWEGRPVNQEMISIDVR